jgi:hypothetical protein
VHLLDFYLKSEKKVQNVRDLHLIGVTSMFVASKLHELHPIKMHQMVSDISKEKFNAREIQKKEASMLSRINFQTHSPTVFCCASALFKISGMEPKLSEAVEKYSVLLMKMYLFSYDVLNVFSTMQLAVFSAIISLKLFQQSKKNISAQKVIYHLIKQSQIPRSKILDNLNFLRDFAGNFKINFPFNRLKNVKD